MCNSFFFQQGYGLQPSQIERPVNCLQLNVLILWRRDYVAHPRNKNGTVARKFLNEGEVLEAVKTSMGPDNRVEGRQLDADDMHSQVIN
jgi:glycoprotein 2-beta-D-xylosyltransferase